MINKISADAKLSVMFKGPPGSGKTAAGLSFPGPILTIYADPNRDTVRQAALDGKDVHVYQVSSWKDYEDLRPMFSKREFGVVEPQTIVVDTWDFISDMCVEDIGGRQAVMQMKDWGTLLHRQKQRMMELVSLALPNADGHPGFNVVVCCHTKENTDEAGHLQSIGPALAGQFKDKIEAYFDYVLLCESSVVKSEAGGKVKEFKIYTVPPTPRHTCKGGRLPAEIVVPNRFDAFSMLNKTWNISTNKEDDK